VNSGAGLSGVRASLLNLLAAGLRAAMFGVRSWQDECRDWGRRSLAGKDYVYIWVDGVQFNVRLEEERLACLVVIGVHVDGTREVIALEDVCREPQEAWASLARDLKRRGISAMRRTLVTRLWLIERGTRISNGGKISGVPSGAEYHGLSPSSSNQVPGKASAKSRTTASAPSKCHTYGPVVQGLP
jgi:hypothetical protein